MTVQKLCVVWFAALVATISYSLLWHAILFQDIWLALGVYTRMDNPVYGYGLLAWVLESGAFVALFYTSQWTRSSAKNAILFSILIGSIVAASTLFGTAAKVEISDVTTWFYLQGGFVFSHFLFLGFVVSIVERWGARRQG